MPLWWVGEEEEEEEACAGDPTEEEMEALEDVQVRVSNGNLACRD